jgi:isopenicillin-N N-acyltransferase like protein
LDDGPIQLIHLSGGPRERGIEHGRHIPDLLKTYWDELLADVRERVDRPIEEEDLRGWLHDVSEVSVSVAPDLIEEVAGISEGGGVEPDVALGVAFGEEVGQLAASLGYHPPIRPAGRCLSIVVPPSDTTTGGYLIAQTWDGPSWTPDPIVYVVDEESGSSVFLADPGWVGGVGLNDRGIGSVHTGVLIDHAPPGMPYSFIARRILQAGDLDTAVRSVEEAPSTAGCHYIVVDGSRAVDVESAGTMQLEVEYDRRFATCAHFLDERSAERHADPENPRSRFRVSRLLQMAEEELPVSPGSLMELLADHATGPEKSAVCLHGGARSLGAVVVDVSARTLWAKAGNPCSPRPICEVQLTKSGFSTEHRPIVPVVDA